MQTNNQMTEQDYLERHLPHRINLLLTFRERFDRNSKTYIKPNSVKDFYICSKDISIMMVRFLLEELGIKLSRKDELKEADDNRHFDFILKIKKNDIIIHKDYDHILTVLKAANRAVAHVEEKDVNHPLVSEEEDLRILLPVINYTEEMVKSNIYLNSGFDYDEVMAINDNDMIRKKIKVYE